MPNPSWWLFALPLIAGCFMPLQAGINSQLARHANSVMAASLISFSVGTAALLLLTIAQRELPSWAILKGMTWWHWTGGLLGAFFIATAAFAGPRVGALLFMALIIAGQLSMAVTLDHFGWAGFREASVSLSKLGGLLLIIGGIWLIRRG